MTFASSTPRAGSPLHPLATLSVIVTSRIGKVAEANGLTPMQARVLGQLGEGPQRMADLARGLGVEKAALTGLIDRAEAKGLMAREAIPGDRRSINVVATEEGQAAAAAFYAQLDADLESLLGELAAGERKAFRAGLEKIVLLPAARADGC